MTSISGMDFDLTRNTRSTINHGYTKATRAALTGESLIKVHNLATTTNFVAKLTKGLQVSTFDPSDLKNPNNFFNFASQWETTILSIEQHLRTYAMTPAFTLIRESVTPPPQAAIDAYEMNLQQFLHNSAINGGDAYSYSVNNPGDPNANPPIAPSVDTFTRPNPPGSISQLVDGGDILRRWHMMKLDDVVHSVDLILTYVTNQVDLQNLAWSFKYLLDGCDSDLKTFVLSKTSHLDPDIARSGPVAFMVIAQRMIQTTENLAQKVINGFIALRLTHFEGKNVVEAIFTVRNVLKFLRYGEVETFAPRTTLVLVYDVFRGSTVGAFRAYVQQAQDIVLKGEANVEIIFDHLQSKYEELLLADRWVPTKKRQSAFHMGDANTRTYAEAEADKKKPPSNDNNQTQTKRDRPTHDKSGRKIDYTPPKKGESHERKTDDGKTEYWCGKCPRWGSHSTDKHDEWRAKFNRRQKKNGDGNGNQSAKANTAASSTTNHASRATVTFLAATNGTQNLQVDSDLQDGIDL